jgi:hypothetical protein
MPGFYVEKARSDVEKTFLQHFWYAEQIGPLNVQGLLLQDVGLPNFETAPHEQNGASLTYKFANFIKYSDATITFYDTLGLFKDLEEWRKKIWEPNTGLQPKKSYAKDTVIVQTDGAGNEKQKYKLVNTWPSKIDSGQLTYTKSEAKVVTLTLVCDYMTVE